MNKLFYVFVLMLLWVSPIFGQRFAKGDRVFVWNDAVLMYEEPDTNSNLLLTIEMGDSMRVRDVLVYKMMAIGVLKSFDVAGNWIKVVAETEEQNAEGWVFDGFLSKFPTPFIVEGEDAAGEDAIYGISSYLNLKVGREGKPRDIQIWDKTNSESIRPIQQGEKYEEDAVYSYKQHYEKGIVHAHESDGNHTIERLELPNWTFWEVYFLLKAFYVYDPNSQRFYFNFENKTFQMEPKDGGVGCHCLFGRVPGTNDIYLEMGCTY